MIKKSIFLRKVVAVAICLAGIVIFASCEGNIKVSHYVKNETNNELTIYTIGHYGISEIVFSKDYWYGQGSSDKSDFIYQNIDTIIFEYKGLFYMETSKIGNSILNKDAYKKTKEYGDWNSKNYLFVITEEYILSLTPPNLGSYLN